MKDKKEKSLDEEEKMGQVFIHFNYVNVLIFK